MVQQSNSWSLAIRYQAQAERHYRRAVEEFERLQPCGKNYRTNPFSAPNPNQMKPLNPMPKEPVCAGGAQPPCQGLLCVFAPSREIFPVNTPARAAEVRYPDR